MLFRFAKIERKKFGLFFGSAFQILSLPVEAGCKGTESFSGNKKNFLFFRPCWGFRRLLCPSSVRFGSAKVGRIFGSARGGGEIIGGEARLEGWWGWMSGT